MLLFLLIPITALVQAQMPVTGTVTDIDGNRYRTVVIGQYTWMAENLKTTTYMNGIKIPEVTDNSAWASLSDGAYCRYDNSTDNANAYGALYNWFAVNTGILCPRGWHVPTDKEWKYLEGYVDTLHDGVNVAWDDTGGRGQAAGKLLKAAAGWNADGGGTDDFGFSALPGGERLSDGRFLTAGSNGFWWSSTGSDEPGARYRSLFFTSDQVYCYHHDKRFGFSVRCIRNKDI
jgi:uncharacterized protein (TIGR02145 family)